MIEFDNASRNRYVKRITFRVRVDEYVYNAIIEYMNTHQVSKSKAIRDLLEKGAEFGYRSIERES